MDASDEARGLRARATVEVLPRQVGNVAHRPALEIGEDLFFQARRHHVGHDVHVTSGYGPPHQEVDSRGVGQRGQPLCGHRVLENAFQQRVE